MPSTFRPPRRPPGGPIDRRRFLTLSAGAAGALALAACGGDGTSDAAGQTPASAASGPSTTARRATGTTTTGTAPATGGFGPVPAGTTLRIASSTGAQQLQLELSGLISELQFEVSEWPNIGAGPDVINAFRADVLDVGGNAGIPPIQAHFQQLGAKIVAVNLVRKPIYMFATKPGSDITSVVDFAGKKLAFSQGQAQGVVLLRGLDGAGVSLDDVELVPLTSNQFLTALQAGQVDIAPLYLAQVPPYIEQYERDGARIIETEVVDLLSVLWAPDRILEDDAKAAALASYIPVWAKGQVWVYEHPQEWIDKYYVATQNIAAEAARQIIDLGSRPELPEVWDEAIAWEQETIDLLAGGDFVEAFDAEEIFDRRFEGLASAAVDAEYREAAP